MNHFASRCMAKASVNVVGKETGSDDEYCLTLESMDESEILSVHATNEHELMRESSSNQPWKFDGEVSAG